MSMTTDVNNRPSVSSAIAFLNPTLHPISSPQEHSASMIYDRECRAPFERVLCECRWSNSTGFRDALVKKNDDLPGASLRGGGEDSALVRAGDHQQPDGTLSSSQQKGLTPQHIAPSFPPPPSTEASSTRVVDLPASSAADKNLVDDGSFHMCCSRPKRVGEQWLLCGRRSSYFPFHCMVGPDWPLVLLVYFLIIGINAVVLGLASPCLGWPVLLIGLGGFLVLIGAYTSVACSDPGIIYQELEVYDEVEEKEIGGGVDVESGVGASKSINNSSGSADDNNSSSPTGSENGSTTPILDNALSGQIAPTSSSSSSSSGGGGGGTKRRLRTKASPQTNNIHGVTVKSTMECGQCQLERPFSARHCHYCGVCVDELDHHW